MLTRTNRCGDTMRQGDLFDDHPQPELFVQKPAPYVVRIDPNNIRAKLRAALAELQAASVESWNTRKPLRYWMVVAPQMSNWLPAEERAELLVEFEVEFKRLAACLQ